MAEDCIESLLEVALQSLYASFKKYDPCRNSYGYDPHQSNVSLHVAHTMLSAGFAVFVEAHYPVETEHAKQLDCLGISPDSKWFLACEFTQLTKEKLSEQLGPKREKGWGMLHDIERLEKFRIRDRESFPDGLYDPEVYRTATNCKCGWGLVGGLYFVKANENPPLLAFWNSRGEQQAERVPHGPGLAGKLNELGAEWLVVPLPAYPTGNRYHLLSAFFPIRGS